MTDAVTIALDAMGGDFGPSVVVPAALDMLALESQVRLILVGDEQRIDAELSKAGASRSERLSVVHASQTVSMDESPSQALRLKKDSSMRLAINLVKDGGADACVSAGNTGALMATARYVLKTLPGIDRPAILSTIPSVGGYTRVLDLGANVDCSAEHLFQFAVMGSALAEAMDRMSEPRVGLLNIGEEEIKGNDQVKQASRIISQSGLNYVGYVEGDDIYKGQVDVVVCDGFVGNVALKSAEGASSIISKFMREEFSRNLLTKAAYLVARPIIRRLRNRIDHRRYNGASLLGLRGIVLKSHGSADAYAYRRAIETAVQEVRTSVPALIDNRLEMMLSERQEQ